LEWVDWLNHEPLLEPIGNIPPAEAEANHCVALQNIKMAAQDSRNQPSGEPSVVQSACSENGKNVSQKLKK
jgi:hypothetical protein